MGISGEGEWVAVWAGARDAGAAALRPPALAAVGTTAASCAFSRFARDCHDATPVAAGAGSRGASMGGGGGGGALRVGRESRGAGGGMDETLRNMRTRSE